MSRRTRPAKPAQASRPVAEPRLALGDTVVVAEGYSHFGGVRGVIVEQVTGLDVSCITYMVKLTENPGGYYRVPQGKLTRVEAS